MPGLPQRDLPRGLLAETALPLYGRTASRLLGDLRSGGARPGDRLPSERHLAERYGVSRVTMRAALVDLRERGMVASSASRGWFVEDLGVGTGPGATTAGATVQGLADFAAVHGLRVRARVLDIGVRPCTVEEAATLRVAPGSPLFELHRLRYLDDLVVVSEHNRVPLHFCPGLPDVDFSRASLYATLRQASPPQVPRVADYSVEARPPSGTEQELLEIDGSVPLLVATQLAFNQDGRPLEYTVAAYRGDRYRFTASITNPA
jgi:GntR family transcriptional regulator